MSFSEDRIINASTGNSYSSNGYNIPEIQKFIKLYNKLSNSNFTSIASRLDLQIILTDILTHKDYNIYHNQLYKVSSSLSPRTQRVIDFIDLKTLETSKASSSSSKTSSSPLKTSSSSSKASSSPPSSSSETSKLKASTSTPSSSKASSSALKASSSSSAPLKASSSKAEQIYKDREKRAKELLDKSQKISQSTQSAIDNIGSFPKLETSPKKYNNYIIKSTDYGGGGDCFYHVISHILNKYEFGVNVTLLRQLVHDQLSDPNNEFIIDENMYKKNDNIFTYKKDIIQKLYNYCKYDNVTEFNKLILNEFNVINKTKLEYFMHGDINLFVSKLESNLRISFYASRELITIRQLYSEYEADHIAIIIISKFFNINFIIYTENSQSFYCIGGDDNKYQIVALLYYTGNHYKLGNVYKDGKLIFNFSLRENLNEEQRTFFKTFRGSSCTSLFH